MKFFKILLSIILFTFLTSPCIFAISAEPEITSPSAILVDNYTGSILYKKNIDKKMYPASITKILTAILVIENCDLNDTATASSTAITSVPAGYSIGDIKVGESHTIENLLEVLLVHSANDAANVLAEHVGGSFDGFADMMNAKLAEIGCNNSHFVNPSGKHDDNHYTTARDLALLMQYCMKNSTFVRISGMRSCKLPATAYSPERDFTTTVEILIPSTAEHPNIYYYPYAIAGKTGFTTEAKNCLVSVCKKDNLILTSVILGSGKTADGLSSRFIETKSIYDFGFDNYEIKDIYKKGDIIGNIEIPNATNDTKFLDVLISEDIPVLANKTEDLSVEVKPDLKYNENLQAPISEGQTIGTASFTVDGVTYTSNVVASHDVNELATSNFNINFDLVFKISLTIAILSVIALIVILVKSKSKTSREG